LTKKNYVHFTNKFIIDFLQTLLATNLPINLEIRSYRQILRHGKS